MANFVPLNNYSLFILDKLIKKYNLKPPFLDIACGDGYLSRHLGELGWSGKAIDYSNKAMQISKMNLKKFRQISVEKTTILKARGKYRTLLLFDVLEHIKNDQQVLKKLYSLLLPEGFLVIAVPSNPREWRWDDNFYGHYRRYTKKKLEEKLIKERFKPFIFYDYTYPFFWILRRIYTKIIRKDYKTLSKIERTKDSSFSYAWNIPLISHILNKTSLLWWPIYFIQFTFFKDDVSKGSSMLVLAKKIDKISAIKSSNR